MTKSEKMERALKIIYTWADFDGALNPEHVKKLCEEALGMEGENERRKNRNA